MAVRMPIELFDRLKERAIKDGCTISRKIKDYIENGLYVDDEWDLDEPNRHNK